jgi:hypothetical protein
MVAPADASVAALPGVGGAERALGTCAAKSDWGGEGRGGAADWALRYVG